MLKLILNCKSIKDLIKLLSINNISYINKDSKITFKYSNTEILFDVNISYFKNNITSFSFCTPYNDDVFIRLKNHMIELYSTPSIDCSNGKTYIKEIRWKSNNIGIILTVLNGMLYLSVLKNYIFKELNFFLISMLGGIAFGLIFFIVFGLAFEFSLFIFLLSLLSGLLWGLLFWFFMFKISNVSLNNKPTKEKNIVKLFKDYITLNNLDKYVYIKIRRNKKIIPALVYFDVNYLYIKFNKSDAITKILKSSILSYYVAGITFFINTNNKTITFNEVMDRDILEDELDHLLGYDNDKYAVIFDIILNVINYYDSCGFIRSASPYNQYPDIAKNMAMKVYREKEVTYETIKNLIYDSFIDEDEEETIDDYIEMIDSLYTKVKKT